jgi:hemerythrin-like domain-containing protein
MSTLESRSGVRPDVRQMFTVHRALRREFRAIPGHVRAVAPGDGPRTRVVAEYVRLILAGLHMHHTGEDEVLWPRLLERAAPSAGLIATMQAQHAAVDRLTERIDPLLQAWERDAAAVRGEQLARLVEDLDAALAEHLDLEEREVLPMISRYITEEEWAMLGEHGMGAMTPRQLPLLFGSVLEEAPPDERASMLATLPAPARLFMRVVGLRMYRRAITRVRAR